MTPPAIGLDFGTTNTVVAAIGPDGAPDLARVVTDAGETPVFRSALAFWADAEAQHGRAFAAGPWAIEAFLEDPAGTRLIQSFKSYAASPLFTQTVILDRRYAFEDLLSQFLLGLKAKTGSALVGEGTRLVMGRPVRFAGAGADPALAVARYERALRRLGFTEIHYALEPVAAAFYFARSLEGDATTLIADFGGGTSDFSIMRFRREGGRVRAEPLGQSGVAVAGDAFDYRIIDHLVSPALGKGGDYLSLGKRLPVPPRYYARFARWEQLALMRGSRDLSEVRSLIRQAEDPEALARFVEIIEDGHGFALYQAVDRLKRDLSQASAAQFRFAAGSVRLEAEVARADFEGWIRPELTKIAAATDEALADAGLGPDAIDRVFLTGGSSFVPAVRRLFETRFGADRIRTGAELESIASGLALIAAEPDPSPWCARSEAA